MGYLAAIGRAKPVTDVTNYYLGLKRDERESQLLAMQQASHAKKMALADIAYRQAKQEEDYQNEIVDIRSTPFWRNMSQTGRDYFTDLIKKNQFEFSGSRRNIYRTMRESPGLMEEFFKVEDNHYAEEIEKLENRLMKEESFTKREEIKQKINDARTGQFNYLQAKEDMARYIFGREGWQAPKPVMYETAEGTEGTWGQPKEGLDERGNPVVYITDKSGNLQILQGVKPPPGKGMKIYDPTTGNLLVDTSGGGIGTPLSKRVQGDVETKIVGGREQLARMEAIAAEFTPEFQEFGGRAGAAWTGFKAWMGAKVPKEEAEFLIKFKRYQRKAIENINLYIKELTGAQMSEREADRLRLAQPDPGEKWYQGDDPITFKSKMDDVIKYTRAAVQRYEYYLANGLTPQQIQQKINNNTAMSLDGIIAAGE